MGTFDKLLEIERCDQLDALSLEEVSDFLEQNFAKNAIECRNWVDKYPYQPVTTFAAAYSSNYIYIDFFVRGNYLRAVNDKDNTPVSQDSCVEFFVKKADDNQYFNFEFNCIGTAHCAKRETRPNKTLLTEEELKSIKRYASCGTRPFEEMEGLFAWNLVVAIPLSLIGVNAQDAPIHLKGNFYKCGDLTSMPHYLSWAPIDTPTPDFHRPEFFGDIILK
ncbi:MAG: hypothetical protein K2J74_01460 [Muribaculaceae bacterium]|nr:hypothetical protein [Muribaculaceae bacterium]